MIGWKKIDVDMDERRTKHNSKKLTFDRLARPSRRRRRTREVKRKNPDVIQHRSDERKMSDGSLNMINEKISEYDKWKDL